MKISCLSDLHGFLINKYMIPECDLIIISGDLCPVVNHNVNFQVKWLNEDFNNWCKSLDTPVICCGGNHDWAYEKCPEKIFNKDYTYLHERGIKFKDINIFGLNWQLTFYNWAFNLPEEELAKKWELIPDDTDIIICHGPAYGYGDLVPGQPNYRDDDAWPQAEHVGSPSMLRKIEQVSPRLYCHGHIHSGYGSYKHNETIIVNASLLNEQYKLVNKPIVVEI